MFLLLIIKNYIHAVSKYGEKFIFQITGLRYFKESLKMHERVCLKVNGTETINMPQEGDSITFTNYNIHLASLFTIHP